MRAPFVAGFVVVVALGGPPTAAADPIKFARYPHVANGRLAFSYHGDIWVAGVDGSNPTRLTAHIARDVMPRFSPDGRWVAFTSNRMGNDDVFVVSATGGEPRQLTHNTTGDTVVSWSPDGKRIIFASSRSIDPFLSPLYTVSVDGGLPEPMGMDAGQTGAMKQDGSAIAFTRIGGAYWRKGYRGNRADDIWVQDLKTGRMTQLTDLDLRQFRTHTQDIYPMWGGDGMIYFASERDGIFNIWRIAPTGGQPVQVTSHRADGVQFPSISPDGRTIAYENEFEIWTLDVPGGTPRKVAIDLAFDPKENLTNFVTERNRAESFEPSQEGDYLVVDFRGEVFIVPTDAEIGEKTQVTSSSWRDQAGRLSPDGRYVAYLSDESREQEVWLFDKTAGTRRKITTHPSFKQNLVWSADSTKLAWVAANRLFVADVAAGVPAELAYNEAGGYQVSGFSTDGRWLAYTRSNDEMNSEVYLFDTTARREFNVTQNPFTDRAGVITPDGRKVVFLSDRDGGVSHLFVVALERITEDPDDPVVKERQKKAQAAKPEAGGQPAAAVRVDTTGIDRRAVQLTRGEDAVQAFFLSADGRLVYFRSRDDKGPGLFSIGIDGRDRKRVADGTFDGLTPSGDRKKVFYLQEGEIQQMELGGDRKKSKVTFTVTVKVDQRTEWAQILDESWRVMKYRFYDEKMHGRDWAAIRARYEPLLKYVGQNEDVYDLANEMIGELNASHTGVSGPPSREMPAAYRSRYLGFEMEPDGATYRVSHVYRGGPADKEWLDLKLGDRVLAIDGAPLKAGDNYWELLNHALNDYVTVRVSSPTGGATRDLRIRTVPSLGDIKYEEWVAKNRAFVEKESGGQIAYVHIRAMNQPSLRRFQNEVTQLWNKKGIVVDIRYNGGGNIDQELLDILERRPYEYWNNRWGARSWGRRPRQAIAGPKVMLINHRSGSDSEVTPMGFRDLGLGRIVGHPTSGGVIATGSYRLINGGSIRTPGSLVVTYDPTKPNNYGINLENYGVEPDVWVENTPEDHLKGFDRELKAAVDEALRMLKTGKWQFTTDGQSR
jgi:tricorn protease